MGHDLRLERELKDLISAMERHLDEKGTNAEFPLSNNPQFHEYYSVSDAQAALTEVCRCRNLNARFSRGGITFEQC